MRCLGFDPGFLWSDGMFATIVPCWLLLALNFGRNYFVQLYFWIKNQCVARRNAWVQIPLLPTTTHVSDQVDWAWRPHLYRILIYHSTPSIYLSYLTLYKGHCFARNIYTRNMALSIFLWLYEYFCLLIFALYYFKIVFFHTWVKPLCRPMPDFNSLRPPRGQIDLYAFLISIIGC